MFVEAMCCDSERYFGTLKNQTEKNCFQYHKASESAVTFSRKNYASLHVENEYNVMMEGGGGEKEERW